MLGLAELADEGDDVEPELVAGQGPPPLGLGPVGAQEGVTGPVVAAPDGEVESSQSVAFSSGLGFGLGGRSVRALIAAGEARATRAPILTES